MDAKKLNGYISKYLGKLESSKNNIEEYYLKKLTGVSLGTQLNCLMSICKLFETDEQRNMSGRFKPNSVTLEQTDVNQLTKENILNLLRGEWYKSLKPQTQQLHIRRMRNYLKYSKRDDLGELLPKKFKIDAKQLSKTDLITRDDLDIILEFSNLWGRTLIMVMYEGALRRDELLSIKKKHIKFEIGYAILKVIQSKTAKRDIPLIESIPYLKEYFDNNYFEPDNLIFPYKEAHFLNMYLNTLKNKIARKYPEWKDKKLYPHLFRHSRLTELALSKLNEPQLRKIAGWTANSDMPKIYFHLDDSDIISIMTDNTVQKPKPKNVKLVICPICNVENKEQNLFCWKCKNLLDEEKRMEAGLHLVSQPNQTNKIKNLYKILKSLSKLVLENYYSKLEAIDNERYRELKDEGKIPNIGISSKEFLKIEKIISKLYLKE